MMLKQLLALSFALLLTAPLISAERSGQEEINPEKKQQASGKPGQPSELKGIDLKELKLTQDQIKKKASAVTISSIDCEEMNLKGFIQYLQSLISKENKAEFLGGVLIGANIPDKPGDGKNEAAILVRELQYQSIPLMDIIDMVCKQTGLTYMFTQKGISFIKADKDTGDLYTRSYRVHESFYLELEDYLMEGKPKNPGDRRKPLKELFSDSGCHFPEGTLMVYDKVRSLLHVRNYLSNFIQIEEILMDAADQSIGY